MRWVVSSVCSSQRPETRDFGSLRNSFSRYTVSAPSKHAASLAGGFDLDNHRFAGPWGNNFLFLF